MGDLTFSEVRVSLDTWIPGCFGMVDFARLKVEEKVLHVVDLKYGQGVRVNAAGNPQIRMYALGLYDELATLYQIDTISMHIVQPRLDHVSVETLPVDHLLAWGAHVLVPGAQAAMAPDAPLVPSEGACRFCRANTLCRARAAANLAVARLEFMPEMMSIEEIAALLPQLDEIQNWASAVKDFARQEAEKGTIIPGHKLVAGRSVRAWSDEGQALEALRQAGLSDDQILTKKLCGIPAAEKALGGPKKAAEIINSLTVKPRGKPVLVAESDPRPAITDRPENDFTE